MIATVALVLLAAAPSLAAQEGSATPPAAAPQGSDEAVPPATAPQPFSASVRSAGFNLTDAEAAYLDADADYTDKFVSPILTVELHAPTYTDEFSRQVILTQLQQVAALDPNGNSVQPPLTMAELQRIAVARRTAIRQAAQQWLTALQANDPNWVQAGADSYGQARQSEVDWYAALRQRLTGGAAPAQPAPGQ